jgi:hypothetical protein
MSYFHRVPYGFGPAFTVNKELVDFCLNICIKRTPNDLCGSFADLYLQKMKDSHPNGPKEPNPNEMELGVGSQICCTEA